MAVSERLIVATPIASGGGRVISSPFQFYTTGEDRLRVVSVNSLVGVRLKIHHRFVDAFGKVQASEDDHVPNSDRTAHTTEHELGVGSLLNLTLNANSGTPLIGQTFVIVQLIRGTGTAAIVLGTLLQGYVTSTQHLAWPGSPIESSTAGEPFIREVLGTTPAAGGNWSETVPAGARWELLRFYGEFTSSAAPAVRSVEFRIRTGAPFQAWLTPVGAGQNANQSYAYTWTPGFTNNADLNGVVNNALPNPTLLQAGASIEVQTRGIQAGDQWAALRYSVREWLEVS